MSSPTPEMIVKKEAHIGWMIFNNPLRMNAVTLDMWKAIPEIVADFEADPDIRVMVLTGAGDRAFVAGADISQFEENRSSADAVNSYDEISGRAFAAIAETRLPTIAMIHGYCIGGGLGIALSCDIRVAADHSTFAIPAAKLGLAYPLEGTHRLVEIVGPSFAKEIFYTARQFSAEEALHMGLINRSVSAKDLELTIHTMCAQIAENAPLTMTAEKRIIDELVKEPGNFDREKCEALAAECFSSEDYAEGRAAFMQKRKPQFKGR